MLKGDESRTVQQTDYARKIICSGGFLAQQRYFKEHNEKDTTVNLKLIALPVS